MPDLPNAIQPPTLVDTYRGFAIFAVGLPKGEDGPAFQWEHGDGDSVEQLRRDIDDWYSDPENPV